MDGFDEDEDKPDPGAPSRVDFSFHDNTSKMFDDMISGIEDVGHQSVLLPQNRKITTKKGKVPVYYNPEFVPQNSARGQDNIEVK